MPNQCYCGHSEAYPWCDGSHARIGSTPAVTDAAAPTETSKAEPPAPRTGFLARLFGRGRRASS